MKIINGFLFCNRRWIESDPTPCVINVRNIVTITERTNGQLGKYIGIVVDNSNLNDEIVVEGNIDDFITDFVKELKLCDY